MKWTDLLVGVGLAACAALLPVGCEEGQPGKLYRCTCQVTCDGQASVWITEVCRKNNDQHAVADVASENCEMVHDSSCQSVSCSCSDCTELQAMPEC